MGKKRTTKRETYNCFDKEPIDENRTPRAMRIGMKITPETKKLLLQLLNNIVHCVEHNVINSPATLGVAAAHLQALGLYLDDGEDSMFDHYYEAYARIHALEEVLQYLPPGFASPWREITDDTSLQKCDESPNEKSQSA